MFSKVTNIRFCGWVVMACVCAGALSLSACNSTPDGSIPITTSSKEAREDYLEGRDLADRLRSVEAHKLFDEALAEDSLFALAYLSNAFVQPDARGFFDNFSKAKELVDSVSDGERLLILATEAAIEGNDSSQEENLSQLLTLYPDDARAHSFLGQLYFNQQRYRDALKQFQRAIALDPDFSAPYNLSGYSYRFLGLVDSAAAMFEKYIDLIPDDPNPYDSYAELLLKKGEFEESIESYRRALALDPGFVASYIGIASNYCYLNQHQSARDELQQLYAVARNDGQRRRALYGLAATYIEQGLLDSAETNILKARVIAERIEDVRSVATDYSALGNVAVEAGDLQRAKALYDSALVLVNTSDMDDITKASARRYHLYSMGHLAIETGQLKRADSLIRKYTTSVDSLSSIAQTSLLHQLKGMLALQSGAFEQALAELSKANPRNPYNLYRTALAYRGKGATTEATGKLDEVMRFNALLEMNYAFARLRAKALQDSL